MKGRRVASKADEGFEREHHKQHSQTRSWGERCGIDGQKDEAHGMRKGLREFHQLSWKTKGIKGNYRSLTLSCIPRVFHSPLAPSGQIAFCNQLGRITVKVREETFVACCNDRPSVRSRLAY